MKARLILANLLIGFFICIGSVTVYADTTEREVDSKYKYDYYSCPMGFDQRANDFYIRNSYTSVIEWVVQSTDETVWTNTEVYGRYIPDMNAVSGTLFGYGTELHLIGISANGWDVVEYDGNRYLLWYEYWSAEEPPKRVAPAVPAPTSNETISTSEEAVEESPMGMYYAGYYELTAYEWTGNPCANGNYPIVGYTVACNSLPLGTTIYIEGYGTYVVEDTGGMGGGVIDIYLGDVDACIQFGRQGANVYIYN